MKHYDFILAGGGLAGLSLACHLAQSSLRGASILIVDHDSKEHSDRTWSFWSDHPSLFDNAVSYRWDRLRCAMPGREQVVVLGSYRYQTIRGGDFYRSARRQLAALPNVEMLHGRIERIVDRADGAMVVIDGQPIHGNWVFDSALGDRRATATDSRYTNLKLTFRGWEIETPDPAFDPGVPTFLDFRTPTKGDVRFFYVLPFAADRALVEYTLFTRQRVARSEAEEAIVAYIRQVLGIEDYRIVADEGGCLPITDRPYPRQLGQRVMAIGVQGGLIKPSTGYAFTRVQEDSAAIVHSLLDQGHPFDVPASSARHRLLDSIMLRAMVERSEVIGVAFDAMFRKNPAQRILRFLDEKTAPWEDLQLMATLPPLPFIQTAVEMLRRGTGEAFAEAQGTQRVHGRVAAGLARGRGFSR